MSLVSRMMIWGMTRAAPADMAYRTQLRMEFLMFPIPPTLLSQVKTMLEFHCVSPQTLLMADESMGGKSNMSADDVWFLFESLDEIAG